MLKRLALSLLLSSCYLFAADPVALLTAGADVKVNGKSLQTAGAPNWPLGVGDEIVTGSAAAALSFPDNALLTLAPATRVVLQQCDRCVVQLFYGSTDYVKPAGSKFEMCALGRPVRPVEGSRGSVHIRAGDQAIVKAAGSEQVASSGACACDAGAAWARGPKHVKLVVLAVGGGAAAAASVALTRPSTASAQ